MVDELLGALSVAALILCYVVVVECLTAAALLLARYIGQQARHLWAMLPEPPERTPDSPLYRLGGGLKRWP
jgi:hypothetical protein